MRGNDGMDERTPPGAGASGTGPLTPADDVDDEDAGATADIPDEPAAEVLADDPEAQDQLLPGPFETVEDPTPHG